MTALIRPGRTKAVPKAKALAERKDKIIELYQDGRSASWIANLTGYTLTRISQILSASGVLRRNPDELLTAADKRAIKRGLADQPGASKAADWVDSQPTDCRRRPPSIRPLTNFDFDEYASN